jgi:hypothetical protein
LIIRSNRSCTLYIGAFNGHLFMCSFLDCVVFCRSEIDEVLIIIAVIIVTKTRSGILNLRGA